MKTVSDLNALIPSIINLLAENTTAIKENGDWTDNYICYDEEGWVIEITYQSRGVFPERPYLLPTDKRDSFVGVEGRVLEILASFGDENEVFDEFTGADLEEMESAVLKALSGYQSVTIC